MKRINLVSIALLLALLCAVPSAMAAQKVLGGNGPFAVQFWAGTSPYQTMEAMPWQPVTDANGNQFKVYELDFERGVIFLEMYQTQVGLDVGGVIGQFYPNGVISSKGYLIDGRDGFLVQGYGSIGNGQMSYLACYNPDPQTKAILVIIGAENEQYFNEAASSLKVFVDYTVADAELRRNVAAANSIAQRSHWTEVVSHTGDYSYNEGNNLGPGYDEISKLPQKYTNFA